MPVFEDLTWRSMVHQTTHAELPTLLAGAPLTFYSGFDPSADSLHIGSLVPIMACAHLQRAGHKPLILVGGGTGLIGDPSFKAAERSLLTEEQVHQNVEGIRAQLARFVTFEGPAAARMVNNGDWLGAMGLLPFLRDIGKHFSVNVMLSRESVRARLEDRDHGISYTEFTYSLLQAYDFLHLCREYDCTLQIGGSDQWGNMVAGMDLTRRLTQRETFALTVPLVTKSDGSKFGKTETGNVWLDAQRTSPYRFYQFWINQSDADAPRYLRFFTFLPQEEILRLEQRILEAPQEREAQRVLAEEVTRLVHGNEALGHAKKATEVMFGGDPAGLDETTLLDLFSEVPSSTQPRARVTESPLLADLLVDAGVFPSKGEARRMIKSGGLYINNQRIEDELAAFTPQMVLPTNTPLTIVRKGKKNYHLIKFA